MANHRDARYKQIPIFNNQPSNKEIWILNFGYGSLVSSCNYYLGY